MFPTKKSHACTKLQANVFPMITSCELLLHLSCLFLCATILNFEPPSIDSTWAMHNGPCTVRCVSNALSNEH